MKQTLPVAAVAAVVAVAGTAGTAGTEAAGTVDCTLPADVEAALEQHSRPPIA